ncbi:MAG: hypothetical protein LBG74_02775 [Spirochaetaceae bacterium]|jgi:hypothetical protein|nr:hypothetical protein [Spirochaetaceae bacterium]
MLGNAKKGSAKGGTKVAVWGLCALALVFGFALVGCGEDNDDDDGPGGPEWDAKLVPGRNLNNEPEGYWDFEDSSIDLHFVNLNVSGKTVGKMTPKEGGDYTLKTRNETTYTVFYTTSPEETYTFTATVEGKELTISGSDKEEWNGTYTLVED